MKILFEAYPYEMKDVKNVLGGLLNDVEKDSKKPPLKYVGYFYNKDAENRDGSKGDIVFILPKVLLDANQKVFGIEPKDIIDFNYEDWKRDEFVVEGSNLSKRQVYDFIFGFAVWIYRAVAIYQKKEDDRKDDSDDEVVDETKAKVFSSITLGQSGKKKDVTFMDIMLSLLDFQRTHTNFIVYMIKMAHSGFNKVSWPKTIARTQPIIQDGVPIYMNPVNKKRVIDFDEELLVIYYSILNYMHDEYGFPIPNQPGYELIKGAKFKSYIKSQGMTRLRQIHYKYYSDDALMLWNLCYAFFDRTSNLQVQTNRRDYMLVQKFETVFEAMIDELIGDKDLPNGLKVGADDKRIDHLYTYKYLIENLDEENDVEKARQIYNIADSKYYERNSNYQSHDVPKQFTYARNVMQWHMDLINGLLDKKSSENREYKDIPLFDPITEGYNIIPNFFISAFADDNLNYNVDKFERSKIGGVMEDSEGETPWVEGKNLHLSYFFWERLFDRSTGFTLHYNVNFLFVLKKYAQNRSSDKAAWKQKVQKQFRDDILEYLNREFDFYQVNIQEGNIEEFLERYYRKIQGKVFSFVDINGNRVLLYAERKCQDKGKGKSFEFKSRTDTHVISENMLLIPMKDETVLYDVVKKELGKDSYELIEEHQAEVVLCKMFDDQGNRSAVAESEAIIEPAFNLTTHKEDVFLIGCYRDADQLAWIQQNNKYNIRIDERRGAEKADNKYIGEAKYLVLYEKKDASKCQMFAIGNVKWYADKEDMRRIGYPNPHGTAYLVYGISKEPGAISIDVQKVLKKYHKTPGQHVYLTGDDILSFR